MSTDDWTTVPSGATTTDPPLGCILPQSHPFLEHYLGVYCSGSPSTGVWNSVTGSTNGWIAVSYDLSAYAGQQIQVAISYVTDARVGGTGVFVDDTHVVIDAADDADGFEGATSTWSIAGPPAGSAPNAGNWAIGSNLLHLNAGTATADTLLLGFGFEHLANDAARANLMTRALNGLLG